MKLRILVVVGVLFIGQNLSAQELTSEQKEISNRLDQWHKAAARADFKNYFDLMTSDAVFIGTDANENWTRKDFEAFSKPYFDKGKAWDFTALERHVFVDKSGEIAWFDELLSTQMKICRGSGVLIKIGKDWKIKHYVLSMTIPNDNSDEVVKIKTKIEDEKLKKLTEEKNKKLRIKG